MTIFISILACLEVLGDLQKRDLAPQGGSRAQIPPQRSPALRFSFKKTISKNYKNDKHIGRTKNENTMVERLVSKDWFRKAGFENGWGWF